MLVGVAKCKSTDLATQNHFVVMSEDARPGTPHAKVKNVLALPLVQFFLRSEIGNKARHANGEMRHQ
jgi:hypothetical protein